MLRFIDSFDHYSVFGGGPTPRFSQILSKWDQSGDPTTFEVMQPGRNGGQSLLIHGDTGNGPGWWLKAFPAARAEWVMGAAFYFTAANWLGGPLTLFNTVYNTQNPGQLALQVRGGYLAVVRGQNISGGGGAVEVLSTFQLPVQHWVYIEFKVTIDAAAGAYAVRLNGLPIASLPDVAGIDTQPNLAGTVDQIVIGPTVRDYDAHVDDLYIADSQAGDVTNFIGDIRIEALLPSGNGTHHAWIPNVAATNYQAVNSFPFDAGDEYDGTHGFNATDPAVVGVQEDTFFYPEPTGRVGRIWGVQALRFARKNDASDRKLQGEFRDQGGGEAAIGPLEELMESYTYLRDVEERNPVTAAIWTPAMIAACQWGYESTNP